MKCDEFNEILPLYLDNKYSEIENIDEFEAHAGSCEKCSEIFAEVFVLHEGLRDYKDEIIQETPELKNMLSNIRELRAKGVTGEDFLEAFDQEREQYKDKRTANLKNQAQNFLTEDRPEEALKCLNEALDLRPGDKEIEAKIAETELVKENIEVYINNIPAHKFTVSDNKLFVELYRGGNAKPVRVSVKYLDQDDYFFVDLSHNDITYYKLTGTTYETKEGKGKILEISSKTKEKASQEVVLIDDEYRGRIRYKVVLSEDADSATLVIDLA